MKLTMEYNVFQSCKIQVVFLYPTPSREKSCQVSRKGMKTFMTYTMKV